MKLEDLNTYDVVLKNYSIGTDLDRSIGNARFEIIIRMYSKRFMEAIRFCEIDRCHEIVEEIIDTVLLETFPKGNFFIYTCENQLINMGRGTEVHDLVYDRVCQINEQSLSPIEKARFAKARKTAELKERPVDLNDRRFIIQMDAFHDHNSTQKNFIDKQEKSEKVRRTENHDDVRTENRAKTNLNSGAKDELVVLENMFFDWRKLK